MHLPSERSLGKWTGEVFLLAPASVKKKILSLLFHVFALILSYRNNNKVFGVAQLSLLDSSANYQKVKQIRPVVSNILINK
jgi:hypothetical protein